MYDAQTKAKKKMTRRREIIGKPNKYFILKC